MNCVSCSISVYHLHWFVCVFFPGVFLGSRVTGACPVTTDLIMRVNVRATTTTTTTTTKQYTVKIKGIYTRRVFLWVVGSDYSGCP